MLRQRPDPRLTRLSEANAPPRVLGVSRVADNQRAILVSLDRSPTDDEMRALHDAMRLQARRLLG